jgi:hypothetical protein
MFQCTMCKYETSKKSNLSRHINFVHFKTMLTCSFCNYTCYSQTSLSQHSLKVHCTDEVFTCKMCSYVFQSHYQLSKHLIIHNKTYACIFCSHVKTKYKKNFLRHMKKCHPNIDKVDYVDCTIDSS